MCKLFLLFKSSRLFQLFCVSGSFFGSVKYVNWVSTMSVRTGRINMVISDHFWLRVQKLHLLLKYSVCDIQSEGSCLKGRGMEVRMMCLEQ